jgi:hypothetical protein
LQTRLLHSSAPSKQVRVDHAAGVAAPAQAQALPPGDVIICVKPEDAKESVIKRVAAVAGEDVTVHPNKQFPYTRVVKVPPPPRAQAVRYVFL